MINEVAAVVVTYNRKELLLQNIRCLLNQKEKSCDVFVIDNASTDGTKEAIDSLADNRIHYINTGANLGGAGGFEFGVEEVVKAGYKYIWIMDDDTLPSPTALKELFLADQKLRGNWGWLSSVAYWTDGSICRMNIQKRNIFKHVGVKEYVSEIAPVKMCSFVSLLVKSEIIREVGLPIGEYFIWTDDYEFTGRISRKYPCYMVPGSKVTHAMKTHTRVNFAQDDASRISRYKYIYRNDVHCYRQYGLAGWAYIFLKDLYTTVDIWRHSDGNKMEKVKNHLGGGTRRHQVSSNNQENTHVKVIYKARNEVTEDSKRWAAEIDKSYRPDLIIFIAKSGFVFAEPMAEYFKCDMADLIAKRPGNESKNRLKPIINLMPKKIIALILSSPLMYHFNEKKSIREIVVTESFQKIKGGLYKHILLVDDSVDTGWTLVSIIPIIKSTFPNADLKIAAYSMISYSKKRVNVDYYRVQDIIVMTCTSRRSKEYNSFLTSYEAWRQRSII